ncbi:hypothetical protein FUA23_06905 [Neolewinella aurantiaca]|uniref:Uncharacterized protein n=1 Tax=Neolewinella aurantiaca TaxID=2602767 RepID=A0A5C7FV69_9BACT|nr:hypothetical protein [Neolewinella aurantiaca]TXF90242.1 hypothetical protein FUA23_06905 [Neolewinella aurantiaca]
MQRRTFLALSAAGLLLPINSCSGTTSESMVTSGHSLESSDFEGLVERLLLRWGDGMLAMQVDSPGDPTTHGALMCPACGRIHGRCMDAVYPFAHLAKTTGEEKYLTAAMGVMEWAERNVSQPDGSWTVMPNPKTWRGISVFGAIALAETLKYHGGIFPVDLQKRWRARLSRVGEYLLANFDLNFTNINYGFTALHAFILIGEVLEEGKYEARARVLGKDAKQWFTKPNTLLFGEGKPSDALSSKGLRPVDLGYNVEESLNGVAHYALHVGDEELLDLLTRSLEGHLAFMLPDGGWDNSWGTRQAKWSYWGSRTTDGSQTAYALMAGRNPAFATAAIRTTQLLERCTAANGLIYGGLHYAEHGVPPCIHHTFAHAKPLAALLDGPAALTALEPGDKLPREVADGVRHFPEVDVWLLARGPWRATVSSYDFIYKEHCFAATGGAPGMVWHEAVGPLFVASMAEYILVEKFNQQPDPDDEEFALTPRLEAMIDGKWYTNLYDLGAKVATTEGDGKVNVWAEVQLLDKEQLPPTAGTLPYTIAYTIDEQAFTFSVEPSTEGGPAVRLVLPLVSVATDEVKRIDEKTFHVVKPDSMVVVQATGPLQIKETKRERVFNMVPGVQALPLYVEMGTEAVSCRVFLAG